MTLAAKGGSKITIAKILEFKALKLKESRRPGRAAKGGPEKTARPPRLVFQRRLMSRCRA